MIELAINEDINPIDMSETQPTSSSSETTSQIVEDVKQEEFLEPDIKKRKISSKLPDDKKYKLEERLGGILCCAVCLDLPRAAVYQCSNGHLMCAGCFTHVLADARLRDETATCPSCRVEISKTTATRNLAVENAVSELPAECQFCNKQFPRNSLVRHEESECEERISGCKYSRIGCPWRGPLHERSEHEKECVHPNRSGADVMEALKVLDQQMNEERVLYDSIFDLLGYEKITFNDVQLKPYRTDEFVHRLFYESSRFSAFNYQWVVKARINNNQKDPTQSSERDMSYQLILKSKSSKPISLSYIVLRGPVGDINVKARIHEFEFTEQNNETPFVKLPLPDTPECNRLLAATTINFRLIMFSK
ncbi:cysteine and histidine-rich protein 1 homolog [Diabrotica virgifera virgifera]|uniref:Cysteine and histidine-rich protein 1 homolog n=1 Tax=Diabrotica virgifera virgifera TaxID=50390 RepID=A0A6P7H1S2_DIAVI|nr:cysteine and histidine-rich protein 1 homolog [Diabrotica virgifera virgifera]